MTQTIANGVVHDVPADLLKALLSDESALERWEDLTPLSRNEWICWTITVKQPKTRINHIERTITELREGKRRPCCWAGCPHRTDKPINSTQKWVFSKQSSK
ncbi:YdeI/OmpD-associated family protein [Candidatus Saccharibacteria bacterium]|nr:YdeI/OmpD-associated family protein [Candidatus Saccharibacteria bacterium]MBI3338395.1 YdeI/OmpD-associated family protein [Candidatus Saccharibacteria bacterium]